MTGAATTRVRIYAGLRSAHLERFGHMVPARVLYTSHRDDFDESLIDPANPPERVGRLDVVRELLQRHHDVVEINEPALVGNWGFLMAQIAVARLRALAAGRPTAVVTYCIGNADPAAEVRARWRLPPRVARLVATAAYRLLVRGIDRIAFGTTGSAEAYGRYVDPGRLRTETRLFEALPAPCPCLGSGGAQIPTQVMFVGSLVPRKGVSQTMAAWDALRSRRPDATLRIIGRGRLEPEVAAWAATRPEVDLEVDPPRARVHEALRESAVLVLLSQPQGHWREQIGLPVLEGLSHGCEVVTTSETGLAAWLSGHGHAVVTPASTPDLVAGQLDTALRRAQTRRGSLSDLPSTDARIAADRWLMTGAAEP